VESFNLFKSAFDNIKYQHLGQGYYRYLLFGYRKIKVRVVLGERSGFLELEMQRHVLVVDGDEAMQALVAFPSGEREDARVTQVGTGKDMHAVLKRDVVDLIILDLGLPDESGLVLARQVRARATTPIIVLTGDQTKESLLAALEIGVDDFVTKPFDPYELRLRIRNILRRASRPGVAGDDAADPRIVFGDFVMDLSERTLSAAQGDQVHLTPNEFRVLAVMARRVGKAVSRHAILDAIGTGDDVPSDRVVDLYVSQLRAKLEANKKKPSLIQSVRGFGYRLAAGS
jgi:two-component system torCAD operon response regulator TorR